MVRILFLFPFNRKRKESNIFYAPRLFIMALVILGTIFLIGEINKDNFHTLMIVQLLKPKIVIEMGLSLSFFTKRESKLMIMRIVRKLKKQIMKIMPDKDIKIQELFSIKSNMHWN